MCAKLKFEGKNEGGGECIDLWWSTVPEMGGVGPSGGSAGLGASMATGDWISCSCPHVPALTCSSLALLRAGWLRGKGVKLWGSLLRELRVPILDAHNFEPN